MQLSKNIRSHETSQMLLNRHKRNTAVKQSSYEKKVATKSSHENKTLSL